MANKIRIKQVDLEGVISASAQIDLLSASNYISFVTQLDTTLSSDAELSAVSSSISQSIHSINQTLNSGLISESSQLTSSYDERYILSGSITQTTWDNIDGKPSGLVSESTDLSPLNSFTASYFTDSSSFDTRVLTEKGRIDAILSASNANTDTFAEIVSLINSVDLDNDNAFATFYTSSNARVSSLENATGSYETKGSGILSGSVSYLDLTNIPSGIVSQSTDLSPLNSFTASYFTDSSSFDSRISLLNEVDIKNSVRLATTLELTNEDASPPIYDNGDSGVGATLTFESAISVIDGVGGLQNGDRILIKDQSNQATNGIYVRTSGTVYTRAVDADTSNKLTGGRFVFTQQGSSNGAKGFVFTHNGIPNIGATSLTVSQFTTNQGVISGSSQLTSSFDTRYTLSGSVQPLPNGLISGSSQLTSSYDSRYVLSSSVSGSNVVGSDNVSKIETLTSASYAALTPVSGTLYIIIG